MVQLKPFRVDESKLTLVKLLGTGAFANVWLGSFQDQQVAVKQLHYQREDPTQLESFVMEIALVASFESPYIVKFIGAAWKRQSDLKAVLELMDGGDLRYYIISNKVNQFLWDEKYLDIHSIVEALVYLHSFNMIHRDLKSRNVLVDSAKGTKLTDFGI
ncbi:Aste57867_13330 [Aphanomyces stellatus]|uniref:Aste57867_13330 protein n=1 Tax=Aphanomyces stellatus TaxID=120398 RepID=A0A485KYQ4_9STRA|nr:hypothetical protein As57867_013281 [Aphanomyces stellatus]VFT90169.1 Aste57867_13330 [Aphanomyces stellatus]